MPITAGTRLGAYEVSTALGAGGMGEVYRARDTKLGRDVAIKVILESLAADPNLIARFNREAKVLAALSHPRIATIFGLEESADRHFLVMELVEGETLAERLRRGPLSADETIAVALQIADALEAAHEKGIVHRDLKPANVKITPEGTVKVLDFGLAKAVERESAAVNAANSPTLSVMASEIGVILGTAAYMSPEQAKGLAADHRSDIFAFGVLLFEMLTARQPFQGETVPEVLASVLVRDADLSKLPPDLSPRFVELIGRCLEKHAKRRWQAIGDVRAELETIAAHPHVSPARVAPIRSLWLRAAPVVVSAIVVGAASAFAAWTLKPAPRQPVVRFSMRLPEGQNFSEQGRYVLAISPDGLSIAYGAANRLYVRSLTDLEPRPIPGTETPKGIASPAFSPDGRSVAYFSVADRAMKRVSLAGGTVVTLCEAGYPFGISWSHGYVFAGQADAAGRGIIRVREDGGSPELIVKVGADEFADGPSLLPDGDTLLFALAKRDPNAGDLEASANQWARAQIVAQSLRTGSRKPLIAGSNPRYHSSGHLLYASARTIYGVPFNLRRLEIDGEPVAVLEGVRRSTGSVTGSADFVVSPNGTAAYVPGPTTQALQQRDLALADRHGTITRLNLPPGPYRTPRVSPDGKRVAFSNDDGKDAFISVYELTGGAAAQRITLGGRDRFPVWFSDGTRITFQSGREGDAAIFWQPLDGGQAERLTRAAAGERHVPRGWSRDGTTLLFDSVRADGASLLMLSRKDGTITSFGGVHSVTPTNATLSPDGRWVAYSVIDQGQDSRRMYLQPFPATGVKYQAGPEGPHAPLWSEDGKMLFYIPGPGRFEAISVTTAPTVAFGRPVTVPRAFDGTSPPALTRAYDMMPDGRFLGVIIPGAPDSSGSTVAAPVIQVVLNWTEDLKARLPR